MSGTLDLATFASRRAVVRRIVMLTAIFLLAATASLVAQQKGPRLLVVHPAFDYGYVPDSSKVAHTYWINNIGTDSLKVFNVKVTCGCTKTSVDRGIVAVNDSMPLEVVFDNMNRLKHQSRAAGIYSNDPASSRYEISFTCYTYVADESTGPLTITKNKRLRLTTADLGKDFAVSIKNVSQETLRTRLIDYPHELITVDMPPEPIAAGAKGDIIVHVKSEVAQKNQLKSFTFEVSDSAKTRYTIPIRLSEPLSALEKTARGR